MKIMNQSIQRVVRSYIERESFIPPQLTQRIKKLVDLAKREKPQAKPPDILDEGEMEKFTKTLNGEQRDMFYRIMTKVIGQLSLTLLD